MPLVCTDRRGRCPGPERIYDHGQRRLNRALTTLAGARVEAGNGDHGDLAGGEYGRDRPCQLVEVEPVLRRSRRTGNKARIEHVEVHVNHKEGAGCGEEIELL